MLFSMVADALEQSFTLDAIFLLSTEEQTGHTQLLNQPSCTNFISVPQSGHAFVFQVICVRSKRSSSSQQQQASIFW